MAELLTREEVLLLKRGCDQMLLFWEEEIRKPMGGEEFLAFSKKRHLEYRELKKKLDRLETKK